jgi:hypothetical protein
MKEQFTHGPWKYERRNVVELQHAIVNAQGEWVADVSDESPDARLIAEAPAMFALLKEYLKQHAMSNEVEPGEVCLCADCVDARQIIYRVEGKSNT